MPSNSGHSDTINRTVSDIKRTKNVMSFPEAIKQKAIELSHGRSAGEVLRALKKEFADAYLPDERTIRRWCKNSSVNKLVNEQTNISSNITDNWKEHNAKLLGVATKLLSNNLGRISKWVTSTGQIEYHLFDEDEVHVVERLTEDNLSGKFEENVSLVYQNYTEWFFKTCFLPHLYAEWPIELQKKGFYILSEEQPYILIETLRLLAERRTFKGMCSVCIDW